MILLCIQMKSIENNDGIVEPQKLVLDTQGSKERIQALAL